MKEYKLGKYTIKTTSTGLFLNDGEKRVLTCGPDGYVVQIDDEVAVFRVYESRSCTEEYPELIGNTEKREKNGEN